MSKRDWFDMMSMAGQAVIGGGGVSIPYIVDFTNKGSIPPELKSDGIFSISSGKAVCDSVYSDNLLLDPSFEEWNSASALTRFTNNTAGGDSIAQDVDAFSGTYAVKYTSVANSTTEAIKQASLTLGKITWLKYSVKAKRTAAAAHSFFWRTGGSSFSHFVSALTTSYAAYSLTGLNVVDTTDVKITTFGAAGSEAYYDDFNLSKLGLSKTILYLDKEVSQPWVRVRVNQPSAFQPWGGVIISLDNPYNPLNFVLGVYDANKNVRFYKCANGTVTSLSLSASLGANNPTGNYIYEIGWMDSTHVQINIDGKVLAQIEITDAAILAGKYCGAVMSGAGGSIIKMSVFPALKGSLLAIGNSITVATTLDEVYAQGYPEALTDLAGAYTNTPFRIATGGYTVAQTKAAIDAALLAAIGIPTCIVVSHGANDVETLPNETTYKANVAYILDALHTKYASAQIYWNTEFRTANEAKTITLHGWNQTVIEDGRTAWAHLGINCNSIFSGHPELMTDTVHPNYAGFVAYAQAIKTMIGW